MIIKFSIEGNPADEVGNPKPFDGDWAVYVRKCFYAGYCIKGVPVVIDDGLAESLLKNHGYAVRPADQTQKPISVQNHKIILSITVNWADARGSNYAVFRSIANALVLFEKNIIDGRFTGQLAQNKKGRVDVKIQIV